jgi:hypothetical protein
MFSNVMECYLHFTCKVFLPGSLKVWDFGAGQVIKSKAGRGTDEDLSILGIIYQRFQGEDHIIIAAGWTNKIRLLIVSGLS